MISCPEETKVIAFIGKTHWNELTEDEIELIMDHREKCPICNAIVKKELDALPEEYFEELHKKIIKGMKDHVNKLPWRQKYAHKYRLFRNNMRAKVKGILKMA